MIKHVAAIFFLLNLLVCLSAQTAMVMPCYENYCSNTCINNVSKNLCNTTIKGYVYLNNVLDTYCQDVGNKLLKKYGQQGFSQVDEIAWENACEDYQKRARAMEAFLNAFATQMYQWTYNSSKNISYKSAHFEKILQCICPYDAARVAYLNPQTDPQCQQITNTLYNNYVINYGGGDQVITAINFFINSQENLSCQAYANKSNSPLNEIVQKVSINRVSVQAASSPNYTKNKKVNNTAISQPKVKSTSIFSPYIAPVDIDE